MKIAITTQGQDLDSKIDPRFGRTKYFVVFDTDSGKYEKLDNGVNLNAMSGAGIQAASNVINTGATAVITGHVGPKAATTLKAGGIKIFLTTTGTVADALAEFKSGELVETDSANVEGHWS